MTHLTLILYILAIMHYMAYANPRASLRTPVSLDYVTRQLQECQIECTSDLLDNAVCDSECNTAGCAYDNGKCTATATDSEVTSDDDDEDSSVFNKQPLSFCIISVVVLAFSIISGLQSGRKSALLTYVALSSVVELTAWVSVLAYIVKLLDLNDAYDVGALVTMLLLLFFHLVMNLGFILKYETDVIRRDPKLKHIVMRSWSSNIIILISILISIKFLKLMYSKLFKLESLSAEHDRKPQLNKFFIQCFMAYLVLIYLPMIGVLIYILAVYSNNSLTWAFALDALIITLFNLAAYVLDIFLIHKGMSNKPTVIQTSSYNTNFKHVEANEDEIETSRYPKNITFMEDETRNYIQTSQIDGNYDKRALLIYTGDSENKSEKNGKNDRFNTFGNEEQDLDSKSSEEKVMQQSEPGTSKHRKIAKNLDFEFKKSLKYPAEEDQSGILLDEKDALAASILLHEKDKLNKQSTSEHNDIPADLQYPEMDKFIIVESSSDSDEHSENELDKSKPKHTSESESDEENTGELKNSMFLRIPHQDNPEEQKEDLPNIEQDSLQVHGMFVKIPAKEQEQDLPETEHDLPQNEEMFVRIPAEEQKEDLTDTEQDLPQDEEMFVSMPAEEEKEDLTDTEQEEAMFLRIQPEEQEQDLLETNQDLPQNEAMFGRIPAEEQKEDLTDTEHEEAMLLRIPAEEQKEDTSESEHDEAMFVRITAEEQKEDTSDTEQDLSHDEAMFVRIPAEEQKEDTSESEHEEEMFVRIPAEEQKEDTSDTEQDHSQDEAMFVRIQAEENPEYLDNLYQPREMINKVDAKEISDDEPRYMDTSIYQEKLGHDLSQISAYQPSSYSENPISSESPKHSKDIEHDRSNLDSYSHDDTHINVSQFMSTPNLILPSEPEESKHEINEFPKTEFFVASVSEAVFHQELIHHKNQENIQYMESRRYQEQQEDKLEKQFTFPEQQYEDEVQEIESSRRVGMDYYHPTKMSTPKHGIISDKLRLDPELHEISNLSELYLSKSATPISQSGSSSPVTRQEILSTYHLEQELQYDQPEILETPRKKAIPEQSESPETEYLDIIPQDIAMVNTAVHKVELYQSSSYGPVVTLPEESSFESESPKPLNLYIIPSTVTNEEDFDIKHAKLDSYDKECIIVLHIASGQYVKIKRTFIGAHRIDPGTGRAIYTEGSIEHYSLNCLEVDPADVHYATLDENGESVLIRRRFYDASVEKITDSAVPSSDNASASTPSRDDYQYEDPTSRMSRSRTTALLYKKQKRKAKSTFTSKPMTNTQEKIYEAYNVPYQKQKSKPNSDRFRSLILASSTNPFALNQTPTGKDSMISKININKTMQDQSLEFIRKSRQL